MPVEQEILKKLESGDYVEGKPDTIERTDLEQEILDKLESGDYYSTDDPNEVPAGNYRSMQHKFHQYPENDANISMKRANDVMKRYFGEDAVKPSEEVMVPDKDKIDSGRVYSKDGEIKEVSVSQYNFNKAQEDVNREITSATDFLADDIEKNKDELSKYYVRPRLSKRDETDMQVSLSPEDIQAPMIQPAGEQDGFYERVLNPNGDSRSLQDFVSARLDLLKKQKKTRLDDLNSRYPEQYDLRGNLIGRDNEEAYNTEKQAIEKDMSETYDNVISSAYGLASRKIISERMKRNNTNSLNPLEIGMEVSSVLGNEKVVEKQKRLENKGIALSPEQKVEYELAGYRAMQYAAQDAFANGRIREAQDLIKRSSDYRKKILDNNPEFKKNQVVRALSDQIYKDENPIYSLIVDNNPTEQDISAAAEKLGIPKEDLKGIIPDDIHNPKSVESLALSSFIKNTAGGIYTLAARNIFKHILGADPDKVDNYWDENWYDNTWFGKNLQGKTPGVGKLFKEGSEVETDPNSDNYLFDKSTGNSGDFNWDVRAIMGQVADGTGQIAALATSASGVSKVVNASKLGTVAAVAKNADKIGLATGTFLTQYDDNYMAAIGAGIEEEGKRNLYATLRTAASAGTEMIMPDTKIINKILGPGSSSGKELIQLVNKEGFEKLTSQSVKPIVLKGLKEGVKDWGKEISEDVLDQTAGTITDMVLAPQKFKNADLAQEYKETIISSMIASALPTLSGGFARNRSQSKFTKELVYQVGISPQPYIDEINRQVSENIITPDEGKKAVNNIYNINRTVRERTPEKSIVNEQPLTRDQKVDYASNLIKDDILREQKDLVKDEVQESLIQNQIDELKAERETILNTAGEQQVQEEPEQVAEQPVALPVSEITFEEEPDFEPIAEPVSEVTPTGEQQAQEEPVVQQPAPLNEGVLRQEVLNLERTIEDLNDRMERIEMSKSKTKDADVSRLKKGIARIQNRLDDKNADLEALIGKKSDVPTKDPVESVTEPDQVAEQPVRMKNEIPGPVEVSDEIVEKFQSSEKYEGRQFTKTLPNGNTINGRYALVDAFAVTPSHSPDSFGTSKGFPLLEGGRNPNDRNYSLPKNRNAVLARSQEYDGRAVTNVPTVDPNGIVIDGNDRTMSGQLAARNKTDGKYIEALKQNAEAYGFTAEQVDEFIAQGKNPRLVLVSDNVLPYTTDTFAQFNKEATKKKSPLETAIEYRRVLPDQLVDKIGDQLEQFPELADFYKNKEAQRTVLNMLSQAGVIDINNAEEYYNPQLGTFTNDGKALLQNIMMSKVLDEDVLRIIQDYPQLTNKIVRALKNVVAIDAAGLFDEKLSDTLNNAVRLYDNVTKYMQDNNIPMSQRERGLDEYNAQQDLFVAKQPETAATIQIYTLLSDRAVKNFHEYTKAMAERIRGIGRNQNVDLFGDASPDKYQLMQNVQQQIEDYGKNTEEIKTDRPDTGSERTGRPDVTGGDIQETQQDDVPGEERSGEEVTNTEAVNEAAPIQKEIQEVNQERTELDAEYNSLIGQYNDQQRNISLKERRMQALVDEGKQDSDEYRQQYAAWRKYRAKRTELNEKIKELDKRRSKTKADKVRDLKIKRSTTGNVYAATPLSAAIKIAEVITKELYNAAVETVARSIEAGQSIKQAIQSGVDYVNDRWFTKWDEPAFRELFGDNEVGYTITPDPEAVRGKKVSKTNLSESNQKAADELLRAIQNDEHTLSSAINYVKTRANISDITKNKIIQYLRSAVNEGIYKASGEELFNKHMKDNDGDVDAAIESLKDEIDTAILAAESIQEQENLRYKYAAAKSYFDMHQTNEGITAGEIEPVRKDAAETNEDQFAIPKERTVDKYQSRFQDKYARLARAQEHARKEITRETDALLSARLKKSKGLYSVHKLREYLGNIDYRKNSFFHRLKKAGIDIGKFDLYNYALHAKERNDYNAELRQQKYFAKVNTLNQEIQQIQAKIGRQGDVFEDADMQMLYNDKLAELEEIKQQKDPRYILMPDGGSGMTNAQADEILDEAKKNGDDKKYEPFVKEFRENVVTKILDYKLESSIIDEKQYNKLKTYYKHYVPLKVDIEEETGAIGEEKDYVRGTGKNGRDLYRSIGSVDRTFKDRNSPVLQSITDLENAMLRAEENKANIALANLIEENPNKNFWEVRAAQYEVLKDKYGRVVYAQEINQPPKSDNVIPVYRAAKKAYIVLNDDGLRQMVKKIGHPTFNKYIMYPTRLLTVVNTIGSPEFIVNNALIDVQDAFISAASQQKAQVVKNFSKYIKSMPRIFYQLMRGNKPDNVWQAWIEEWRKNGGEVSFMKDILPDKQAQKTLKIYDSYGKPLSAAQANRAWNGIKNIGAGLEQLSRVAMYRSAVEAGIDKEKAAVISRNATVDFEKKGTYGLFMNAFKAFLNAGTQGGVNLAYMLFKSKGRKRVAKIATAMMLAGAAEVIINSMLSDCEGEERKDNCYDEVPEWQKKRNYMIRNPFGDGFLHVSMGRQLGWFPYVGKVIASAILGKIDKAEVFSSLLGSLLDYYNPAGGSAPIDQQIMGNYAFIPQLKDNRNGLNYQIKPENNYGVPEHMNYFPNTPQAYVSVAEGLSNITGGKGLEKDGLVEISPDELEYALQYTTGGIYNFLMRGYNLFDGEKDMYKDLPFVNRFYRESNMSVSRSAFYDLVNKGKTKLLTDEELDQVDILLDRLYEGGIFTEEQAQSNYQYLDKNQKRIRSARNKIESDNEEEE